MLTLTLFNVTIISVFLCCGVRYWQMDITQLKGGKDTWDKAVADASEEYKGHMVSGHRKETTLTRLTDECRAGLQFRSYDKWVQDHSLT